MIILMYGCGLRTTEVCSLRIKEIDFEINSFQKLKGHIDISTTEIYLHIIKQEGLGVKKPADSLIVTN